jgi:hypothetical protein
MVVYTFLQLLHALFLTCKAKVFQSVKKFVLIQMIYMNNILNKRKY